jgi:hypothetical protein
MKRNIRTSLLEEAKSPTQYAEELASHWKRVSSALKKASYVLPDARNRLDGYDVLMQSYDVGDHSIVNLVSFPETEDLCPHHSQPRHRSRGGFLQVHVQGQGEDLG